MEETDLFEELLNFGDANLNITLSSPRKYEKTKIDITSRKPINKETLWKILKLVDKREAKLKLLAYGVLEITF